MTLARHQSSHVPIGPTSVVLSGLLLARLNNASERPPEDPLLETLKYLLPLPSFLFFFSSPALFAYWLRSSVVSVLFSLISESFLRKTTLIIPIFGSRDLASVLAHASLHSVIGLTLPPIDANSLFHQLCWLVQPLGEEAVYGSKFEPSRMCPVRFVY